MGSSRSSRSQGNGRPVKVSVTSRKCRSRSRVLRRKGDTTGWNIEREQASEEGLYRVRGRMTPTLLEKIVARSSSRFQLSAAVRAVLLH